MRSTTAILLLFGVLALWAGVPARCADAEKSDFFNGKNLDGWEGIEKYWSVKDGAIVGYTAEDP